MDNQAFPRGRGAPARARWSPLLQRVAVGPSSALVLRGEAGVGKTALLGYVAERASSGYRIVRAVGVQSEMELAFAGVHQLCASMLDRADDLPGPQRDALRVAFGLQDGDTPDHDALAGSGRPFLLASGVALGAQGDVVTENDLSPFHGPDSPRGGSENLALEYVARDVRTVSVRFAPTVHGAGDNGFIATLVGVAREKGVAGYVADGANRWAAIHRSDAAQVVRLGLEQASAGTILHAVGEEGIRTKDIATAIGRGLGVEVVSVPVDDAQSHFGWIGGFFAMDIPASSELTQKLLGSAPAGPTLIEDLDAGPYFRA